MATARDVVTDALRELGVLAAGEVASADDELSGLSALNRLIDQWAAERLTIYTITRTTYALVSGTQNYTVGSGGNFNVARPVFVDHVRLLDTAVSPTLESGLVPFTDDAWALVTQKALTSTEPTNYYYNPTFPLGTLTLWPVPTGTTLTGVLYAPQQVAELANLNTAISLPPGYRRMLVKNLALEMSPSYERPSSVDLRVQAAESKMVVKQANVRLMDMTLDPAYLGTSSGRYNINVDG